jgi:hypothetical protein
VKDESLLLSIQKIDNKSENFLTESIVNLNKNDNRNTYIEDPRISVDFSNLSNQNSLMNKSQSQDMFLNRTQYDPNLYNKKFDMFSSNDLSSRSVYNPNMSTMRFMAEIDLRCDDHLTKHREDVQAARYCSECKVLCCDSCVIEFHSQHIQAARVKIEDYFKKQKLELEDLRSKINSSIKHKSALSELHVTMENHEKTISNYFNKRKNFLENLKSKIETILTEENDLYNKLTDNLQNFYRDECFRRMDKPLKETEGLLIRLQNFLKDWDGFSRTDKARALKNDQVNFFKQEAQELNESIQKAVEMFKMKSKALEKNLEEILKVFGYNDKLNQIEALIQEISGKVKISFNQVNKLHFDELVVEEGNQNQVVLVGQVGGQMGQVSQEDQVLSSQNELSKMNLLDKSKSEDFAYKENEYNLIPSKIEKNNILTTGVTNQPMINMNTNPPSLYVNNFTSISSSSSSPGSSNHQLLDQNEKKFTSIPNDNKSNPIFSNLPIQSIPHSEKQPLIPLNPFNPLNPVNQGFNFREFSSNPSNTNIIHNIPHAPVIPLVDITQKIPSNFHSTKHNYDLLIGIKPKSDELIIYDPRHHGFVSIKLNKSFFQDQSSTFTSFPENSKYVNLGFSILLSGGYQNRKVTNNCYLIVVTRKENFNYQFNPSDAFDVSIIPYANMLEQRERHNLIYLYDRNMVLTCSGFFSSTAEITDINSGIWKQLPKMNDVRANATITYVNKRYVWVFGGFKINEKQVGVYQNTCEVLDLNDLHAGWSLYNFDKMNINFKLSAMGVVNYNENSILLCGGYDGTTYRKDVHHIRTDGRVIAEVNTNRKNCLPGNYIFLHSNFVRIDNLDYNYDLNMNVIIFDPNEEIFDVRKLHP